MKPTRNIVMAMALAFAGSIPTGCAHTDADWAAVKYCGLGTANYNTVLCAQAREQQRRGASDRRERADARAAAARARGGLEAQRRWREEVRQARLDEASSQHWLNGVWCNEAYLVGKDPTATAHRFDLVGGDAMVITHYGMGFAADPASLYKRTATIHAVADAYEISYERDLEINRKTVRLKEFLVVDRIDDDRYRSVTLDEGRHEKAASRRVYRRCTDRY